MAATRTWLACLTANGPGGWNATVARTQRGLIYGDRPRPAQRPASASLPHAYAGSDGSATDLSFMSIAANRTTACLRTEATQVSP
jgi:hypothetical protein